MEWEADYYGLEELLRIIGERKKGERPKMSSLECEEKAAEMLEKAEEAIAKMVVPNPRGRYHQVWLKYRNLAKEYESQAADLRRRGY